MTDRTLEPIVARAPDPDPAKERERLNDELYPEQLRSAERRNGYDARIGIALSGGGIRSATLSLGFFQSLARKQLLRHVDVLSTVSGGGFFGGFFGHLVQRASSGPAVIGKSADRSVADRVLDDPSTPAVKFLRENGRYLSPNGAGDLLSAAAAALRNWVAVIVVLGTLALLVSTLLTLVRYAAEGAAVGVCAGSSWAIQWLSPWFLVVLLAVPLLAVPPGWAYWLVPDNPQNDGLTRTIAKWLAPIAGVVLPAFLLAPVFSDCALWTPGQWTLAVVGLTSALTVGWSLFRLSRTRGEPSTQRNHLTRDLTRALIIVGALLLLAIVDSAGQGFVWLSDADVIAFYGGAVGLIGVLRTRLLALASRLRAHERTSLPTALLVPSAAALLLLAFLGGIASVPHFVARGGAPISPWFPSAPADGALSRLWILAAGTAALVVAVSRLWPFVNRSSLHAIYEARLRRAYLGASNPARSGEGTDRPPVTEPHPGDGLDWSDYDPSRHGGPLHLINVTINETVDGRSQVQQRDRKGVGMAIGPAGVTVGRTHHATWETVDTPGLRSRMRAQVADANDFVRSLLPRFEKRPSATTGTAPARFRVFPSTARPELLNVGQWMAISGGAVSTGLGSRTNVGLSLLIGFFNIRLGYWWHSGVKVARRVGTTSRTNTQRALTLLRSVLPVQSALVDEWLARFPGTARADWNLTDGGHFENLGAYELLRRQLPLIILCDNEQDAGYEYSGLGNLVRKARTDLRADITFLSETELRGATGSPVPPVPLPSCVGSLDALRRGRRSREAVHEPGTNHDRLTNDGAPQGLSLVHASLARVEYRQVRVSGEPAPSKHGWLLYVKPSLDGDEPVDVQQYHTEHPEFPHEATSDQYFGEAQWESYRRLGEHLGERVVTSTQVAEWIERVARSG